MKIFGATEICDAQSHRPQIECFVLSDGRRIVIERPEDYAAPGLPTEVAQFIAARNAPPVPSVPESISRTAALLAVDDLGLAPAYTAWSESPDRTFREKAFLGAATWRRKEPVLLSAAEAFGVTESQIDALFIHAKSTYDAD